MHLDWAFQSKLGIKQIPFNGSLLLGLVANIFAKSDPLSITGGCVC